MRSSTPEFKEVFNEMNQQQGVEMSPEALASIIFKVSLHLFQRF